MDLDSFNYYIVMVKSLHKFFYWIKVQIFEKLMIIYF
jgi:hypothetical protein